MRSVDEVFRPVLPEPNLVSETPRGYSQSLTVGPQFESQTKLKTKSFSGLIAVSETSPDVKNVLCWNSQVKKKKRKKEATHIHTQRSVLPTLTQIIMPVAPQYLLVFLHLDRVSCSPARYCYITESMAENVFSVSDAPHHFFHGKNKKLEKKSATESDSVCLFIRCWCQREEVSN